MPSLFDRFNPACGTFQKLFQVLLTGGFEGHHFHLMALSQADCGSQVNRGQIVSLVGYFGHSDNPHTDDHSRQEYFPDLSDLQLNECNLIALDRISHCS